MVPDEQETYNARIWLLAPSVEAFNGKRHDDSCEKGKLQDD